MSVLFRIAVRNLREHKSKTLIIGLLIAIGIAILVIGNSMIDTSARGIERTFIDNYTGHIMISGISENGISLFGVSSMGNMENTPVIPEYKEILNHVQGLQDVEAVTSQISGFGLLSIEEEQEQDSQSFSILFGIDAASYRNMFDNLEFIKGSYLSPGTEGILLTEDRVQEIEEKTGLSLSIGDPVILNGFGNAGFKIREVPLQGIFRFKHESEGMDVISYVDVQTLRALLGMTLGSTVDVNLLENETALLEIEDTDILFDDFGIDSEEAATESFEEDELFGVLGDLDARESALELDQGSWHFILIKLHEGRHSDKVIEDINSWLIEREVKAEAVNWKQAAGPYAASADILRTVFTVAILIVAVVAVIIIMNTLVISVIERTPEIGMMRALGARKGFVWKMFLTETLTVSSIFGIIGIILGILFILILGVLNIQASNDFLKILFAGPVLKPIISPMSILYAFIVVIMIGIISHIYPVLIALKIQPVKAIQTE